MRHASVHSGKAAPYIRLTIMESALPDQPKVVQVRKRSFARGFLGGVGVQDDECDLHAGGNSRGGTRFSQRAENATAEAPSIAEPRRGQLVVTIRSANP